MSINVLLDLIDMLLFHILTTDAERVRLAGSVFMIVNGRTISLSHLPSEVGVVIVIAVRGPVVDIASANSSVSETF